MTSCADSLSALDLHLTSADIKATAFICTLLASLSKVIGCLFTRPASLGQQLEHVGYQFDDLDLAILQPKNLSSQCFLQDPLFSNLPRPKKTFTPTFTPNRQPARSKSTTPPLQSSKHLPKPEDNPAELSAIKVFKETHPNHRHLPEMDDDSKFLESLAFGEFSKEVKYLQPVQKELKEIDRISKKKDEGFSQTNFQLKMSEERAKLSSVSGTERFGRVDGNQYRSVNSRVKDIFDEDDYKLSLSRQDNGQWKPETAKANETARSNLTSATTNRLDPFVAVDLKQRSVNRTIPSQPDHSSRNIMPQVQTQTEAPYDSIFDDSVLRRPLHDTYLDRHANGDSGDRKKKIQKTNTPFDDLGLGEDIDLNEQARILEECRSNLHHKAENNPELHQRPQDYFAPRPLLENPPQSSSNHQTTPALNNTTMLTEPNPRSSDRLDDVLIDPPSMTKKPETSQHPFSEFLDCKSL